MLEGACKSQCMHEPQVGAYTFPQQALEPDSTKLASLVSPSNKSFVALSVTDCRGIMEHAAPSPYCKSPQLGPTIGSVTNRRQ